MVTTHGAVSEVRTESQESPQPPTRQNDPVRTALNWLPRILLVLLLIGVARWFTRNQLNMDTWFHLRLGDEFRHHWSASDPGTVSQFNTNDWLPTQWLSQVVMSWLNQVDGLVAVSWYGALQVLTFLLCVFLCARRHAPATVAAPLTALVFVGSLSSMSARPQVISLVLFTLMVGAWLQSYRDGKVRWWLVPGFWVWAMLHGMWPVGLGIAMAALLGMALDRRHPPRRLLKLAAAPVLGLLSTLLTPVGPGLFGAVLLVNSRSDYFTEWNPPDFTSVVPIVAALPVLACLVVLTRRGRAAWFDLGMVLALMVLLGYSQRTLPLAAAGGAVMLAWLLGPSVGRVDRGRRGDILTAWISYAVTLAVAFAMAGSYQLQKDTDYRWLDRALADLPDHSVLLTDMTTGSRSMYRFSRLDVPIHGYGDMMSDEEIENARILGGLQPGWIPVLERLAPRAALLPKDSALLYNLTHVLGWIVTAKDDTTRVAMPPQGCPVTGCRD